MTARKHPPDEPAAVVGRTTERTTVTKETLPDTDARDAPIEVWLADLAGDARIMYVRVWKRAGSRWAFLGKRNDIPQPFDFDPDALFQQYGDGEYRFVPYDNAGKMRGGRNELVAAGFRPTIRTAPDGTTTPTGEESTETGDLSELIRMERQRVILNNLRAASGAGDPGPYPSDRGGDDLDRMAQLASVLAALQPKATDFTPFLTLAGSILTPLITRLMQPPQPADQLLGLVDKVLDIRERIGEGGTGEPDWKTAIVRAVAGIAQTHPQLLALLTGTPTPAPPPMREPAPLPALPAGTPAVVAPYTGPTVTAPSPSNGHPSTLPDGGPPLTADEQHQQRTLATMIWPLVKQAALHGTDDFETYASLIDQQLPGFLEQWSTTDANGAMVMLGTLDRDVLTNIELQRWCLAFHAFVREDFLQRTDDPPGEGAQHE
jgi:hypothetical protein